MLTYKQLGELARTLGEQTVLSVYVNGELHDPAQRRRWRIELRHAFDDIAVWLKDATHAEREDFAACREMAEQRLDAFGAAIRAPGWVGLFTPEGEKYVSSLPVAVSTLAVWSTGPSLSPYVRAMKEARAVIVGVVDSRSARLFRYVDGVAKQFDTLEARALSSHPEHMGQPARVGFHSGTRGRTGTDEAQRALKEGTERLLADVAIRISSEVGDGWIVVGGIPSVAVAALTHLAATLSSRAVHAELLDVHATEAQVADAARAAAEHFRDAEDLGRLGRALGSAESNGRGAMGTIDTIRALKDGQVRELYFTQAFLDNQASDAELAVRLALGSGAAVEHVAGESGKKLDAVGGIAASLRYPQPVGTQ